MIKPEVRKALERLIEHLQRKGAHVVAVYLPAGDGGKVGVDDWLAQGHSVNDLEALIESPRPEVKAAEPIVELLDTCPAIYHAPSDAVGRHGLRRNLAIRQSHDDRNHRQERCRSSN